MQEVKSGREAEVHQVRTESTAENDRLKTDISSLNKQITDLQAQLQQEQQHQGLQFDSPSILAIVRFALLQVSMKPFKTRKQRTFPEPARQQSRVACAGLYC